MSRGMGKIQQEIVQLLCPLHGSRWKDKEGWMYARTLAHLVYCQRDPAPYLNITRAERMSVQRAIRGLKKRGMVETRIQSMWGWTRPELQVRLTLKVKLEILMTMAEWGDGGITH